MKEQRILISGYGAAGAEDITLYAICSQAAQKRWGFIHGRAPSFCCQGENNLVYVASERSDGADITAYALEENEPRLVAALETPGAGLCHLFPLGGVIYGSCYESGHFFAVDAALTRVLWQFCPAHAHAHWANAIDGCLLLADLGNDCLYRFQLENDLPQGEGERISLPSGSGPRQILHADDRQLLCIHELDGQVRLLSPAGVPQQAIAASVHTEPQNFPGGACQDGSGRIYVCNRGPNTLSALTISEGELCREQEFSTGDWPRHLAVLENGLLLVACQKSGEAISYSMAASAAQELFRLPLPGASCILPLR